jgi:hypothetical protein
MLQACLRGVLLCAPLVNLQPEANPFQRVKEEPWRLEDFSKFVFFVRPHPYLKELRRAEA